MMRPACSLQVLPLVLRVRVPLDLLVPSVPRDLQDQTLGLQVLPSVPGQVPSVLLTWVLPGLRVQGPLVLQVPSVPRVPWVLLDLLVQTLALQVRPLDPAQDPLDRPLKTLACWPWRTLASVLTWMTSVPFPSEAPCVPCDDPSDHLDPCP